MWEFIKTYLVTFAVFFAIDIVWLGVVAKDLYRKELGFIMADKANWVAAFIFYAIFIVGLIFFVINPYSTYDLTNLATLKDWPLKITIIDLIWGTSLGGLVSTVSYFILQFLK